MTPITQYYKKMYIIFTIIDMIFAITPVSVVAGIVITKLVNSSSAGAGKGIYILIVCLIAAVIFTMIDLLRHAKIRSATWIILFGISICISHLTLVIGIIMAAILLDEIVFSPIQKYFKQKYSINKEIDHRGVS